MPSSPRSPSSTIRIFSSAENRRRVCRRISRTTFSVDPAFVMGGLLPCRKVSLTSRPYVVHIGLTPHNQPQL